MLCLKIETGAVEDESEGSDTESNVAVELSKTTEMRLVPPDPSQCTILISLCVTVHVLGILLFVNAEN